MTASPPSPDAVARVYGGIISLLFSYPDRHESVSRASKRFYRFPLWYRWADHFRKHFVPRHREPDPTFSIYTDYNPPISPIADPTEYASNCFIFQASLASAGLRLPCVGDLPSATARWKLPFFRLTPNGIYITNPYISLALRNRITLLLEAFGWVLRRNPRRRISLSLIHTATSTHYLLPRFTPPSPFHSPQESFYLYLPHVPSAANPVHLSPWLEYVATSDLNPYLSLLFSRHLTMPEYPLTPTDPLPSPAPRRSTGIHEDDVDLLD